MKWHGQVCNEFTYKVVSKSTNLNHFEHACGMDSVDVKCALVVRYIFYLTQNHFFLKKKKKTSPLKKQQTKLLYITFELFNEIFPHYFHLQQYAMHLTVKEKQI